MRFRKACRCFSRYAHFRFVFKNDSARKKLLRNPRRSTPTANPKDVESMDAIMRPLQRHFRTGGRARLEPFAFALFGPMRA